MHTIANPDTYPIQPEHIDASRIEALMGSQFQHLEREVSAMWIVRFCQQKGNWDNFPKQSLQHYCTTHGHSQDYNFNGLDRLGFIEVFDGPCAIRTPFSVGVGMFKDVCAITHEFVAICFHASPAAEIVNVAELLTA
jgi:hypothetical protein